MAVVGRAKKRPMVSVVEPASHYVAIHAAEAAVTPLEVRRNLGRICEYLVDLARGGKIGKDACRPRWRPGDAYLLRHSTSSSA